METEKHNKIIILNITYLKRKTLKIKLLNILYWNWKTLKNKNSEYLILETEKHKKIKIQVFHKIN